MPDTLDRQPAGKLLDGVDLYKKIQKQAKYIDTIGVEHEDYGELDKIRVDNIKKYESMIDEDDHKWIEKYHNYPRQFIEAEERNREESLGSKFGRIGQYAKEGAENIFYGSGTLASGAAAKLTGHDPAEHTRKLEEAAESFYRSDVPGTDIIGGAIEYGPPVLGALAEGYATNKAARMSGAKLFKHAPKFAETKVGRAIPYAVEVAGDTLVGAGRAYLEGRDTKEAAQTSAFLSTMVGTVGYLSSMGLGSLAKKRYLGLDDEDYNRLYKVYDRSGERLKNIEGGEVQFTPGPKNDAISSASPYHTIGINTSDDINNYLNRYRAKLGPDLDNLRMTDAEKNIMIAPVRYRNIKTGEVGETVSARKFIQEEIDSLRQEVGDQNFPTTDKIKSIRSEKAQALQDLRANNAARNSESKLEELYNKALRDGDIPKGTSPKDFKKILFEEGKAKMAEVEALTDQLYDLGNKEFGASGGVAGKIVKGINKIEADMRNMGELDLHELAAIRKQINRLARDVADSGSTLVGAEHMVYKLKSNISRMFYRARAGNDVIAAQWFRYNKARNIADMIDASPDKYKAIRDKVWNVSDIGGVNPRNILQEFSTPDAFRKHRKMLESMSRKVEGSQLIDSFSNQMNRVDPIRFSKGRALDLFELKNTADQVGTNLSTASRLGPAGFLKSAIAGTVVGAGTMAIGGQADYRSLLMGAAAAAGVLGGESFTLAMLKSPTMAKAMMDPEIVGFANKILSGAIPKEQGKKTLVKMIKNGMKRIARSVVPAAKQSAASKWSRSRPIDDYELDFGTEEEQVKFPREVN